MRKDIEKLINPFRFDNPQNEKKFVYQFCVAEYRMLQAGCLLMGVLIYALFIMDRILDPAHADLTQAIRGFIIVPITWIGASLVQIRSLRSKIEWLSAITCISVMTVCIYICTLINKMFDTAVAGGLILALFFSAFVPCRFPFYVCVNVASWAIFDAAQLWSGNYSEGMFLINNLYASAGVLLGIIAGMQKEVKARERYKTNEELIAAKKRVDELLAATLTSYEIARMHRSPAQAQVHRVTIAISYRRADSEAFAGRLRDRLVGCYGPDSIFMDIDSIPPGMDFRTHVNESFHSTDIVLAIIGRHWLVADGAERQRIKADDDPVRVELEIALAQKKTVIPILIGDAPMPSTEDLPGSLVQFPYLNAVRISPGKDFPHHFEFLIRTIDRIADQTSSTKIRS